MHEIPDIAILIPVYQEGERLEATLYSLSIEEYYFHVYIVDDGSIPPVILDESNYNYPITLLRYERNRGIEYALNFGLEKILKKGFKFISRLDSGDICISPRLQLQKEYLENNPHMGVVGTWVNCVNTEGHLLWVSRYPTNDKEIRKLHYFSNSFWHSTVLIRSEAILDCGKYDESYKSCEDFELWVRIGKKWQLGNLPIVSLNYEINNNGISVQKRITVQKNLIRVLMNNFNPTSIHSYLGLLKRLIVFILPHSTTIQFKKFTRRSISS